MTLLMEEPTSSFYERLHILLQKVTATTTTTKVKKKKFICWVAREVYGINDERWIIFRTWLITQAPLWFVKLYVSYGEKFAKYISDKPKLKAMIKWWMNKKIKEKSHGTS